MFSIKRQAKLILLLTVLSQVFATETLLQYLLDYPEPLLLDHEKSVRIAREWEMNKQKGGGKGPSKTKEQQFFQYGDDDDDYDANVVPPPGIDSEIDDVPSYQQANYPQQVTNEYKTAVYTSPPPLIKPVHQKDPADYDCPDDVPSYRVGDKCKPMGVQESQKPKDVPIKVVVEPEKTHSQPPAYVSQQGGYSGYLHGHKRPNYLPQENFQHTQIFTGPSKDVKDEEEGGKLGYEQEEQEDKGNGGYDQIQQGTGVIDYEQTEQEKEDEDYEQVEQGHGNAGYGQVEQGHGNAGYGQVEQGTGYGQVEQGTGYGQVEQGTGYGQVEQGTGYGQVEQGAGYGQVEQGHGNAGYGQVEQGTGYGQVEQGTGYGQVEQGTGYRQVEQGTGYGQVEQGTGNGGYEQVVQGNGNTDDVQVVDKPPHKITQEVIQQHHKPELGSEQSYGPQYEQSPKKTPTDQEIVDYPTIDDEGPYGSVILGTDLVHVDDQQHQQQQEKGSHDQSTNIVFPAHTETQSQFGYQHGYPGYKNPKKPDTYNFRPQIPLHTQQQTNSHGSGSYRPVRGNTYGGGGYGYGGGSYGGGSYGSSHGSPPIKPGNPQTPGSGSQDWGIILEPDEYDIPAGKPQKKPQFEDPHFNGVIDTMPYDETPALPGAFTCFQRKEGYYADYHSGCKRFYRCAQGHFQAYEYVCPYGTKFNDHIYQCDHDYNVACRQKHYYG